jgi:GH24 family phage-related lysozyme (muramidase)
MKITLSQNGINLIKSFEGCRLTAYVDTSGVLTIGYGHTGGVTKGQTITQAQADEILKKDLANYANGVQGLIDNKTILFNVNQTKQYCLMLIKTCLMHFQVFAITAEKEIY